MDLGNILARSYSLPACRSDGEVGNKTSYSPTGAWIGAEFGNIKNDDTLGKICHIAYRNPIKYKLYKNVFLKPMQ